MVVVRTTSVEYLDAWREREIDVDFMVSSELETANAISGLIGIPAARQTDMFADGQVQVVEFDVPDGASNDDVIGTPLREAAIPEDSKVVSIIRGDELTFPRGDERILAGDRIIVIGSPGAAREWSRLISHEESARRRHRDLRRRPDGHDDRARAARPRHPRALRRGPRGAGARGGRGDARRRASSTPARSTPSSSSASGSAAPPPPCSRSTTIPATCSAPCWPRRTACKLTIALAHDQSSLEVYERGGVDVAINPRQVIAEELVRFGHDPRIRQIAMLDDDRFEILDLTVRPESELAGKRFDELPETGSVIGAIVRDGRAFVPHGTRRAAAPATA